ncbi:uncharacterized protein LOC100276647 [Zea mays]|uniref:uncharacterized protein LOC100276647 n=1 Tax=Zea mays TaxID=4577 RepID=UPI000221B529|nr:uncharacterized protein LOC100276647 [Zea mays]|eukprot:NP_001143856.2 uncharacterized protein LOC100276647 [Zea mays]
MLHRFSPAGAERPTRRRPTPIPRLQPRRAADSSTANSHVLPPAAWHSKQEAASKNQRSVGRTTASRKQHRRLHPTETNPLSPNASHLMDDEEHDRDSDS